MARAAPGGGPGRAPAAARHPRRRPLRSLPPGPGGAGRPPGARGCGECRVGRPRGARRAPGGRPGTDGAAVRAGVRHRRPPVLPAPPAGPGPVRAALDGRTGGHPVRGPVDRPSKCAGFSRPRCTPPVRRRRTGR
ncbi:hypothetical protein B6264_08260 [Kitasatospora aureofaciens]|nr:hypothetical protein B6264_08260 [Kitasatospora aureofaciens]